MFRINANKSIKISRGEDSSRFAIMLYKNNDGKKVEYPLSPLITIVSDNVQCRLDSDIWKKVIKDDGVYSFMYNKGNWWLEQKAVPLDCYGIECLSTPNNYDTIIVTYSLSDATVYFYICEINSSPDDYLVKKTFTKDGLIKTDYFNRPQRKIYDDNIINKDGEMMLRIEAEDTIDLDDGEYYYIIKSKMYDEDLKKFTTRTITNELPIYVVDDGINRRW